MCLHLTPIAESLTEYFLKYSSRATIIFQVKAGLPHTADSDIAIQETMTHA